MIRGSIDRPNLRFAIARTVNTAEKQPLSLATLVETTQLSERRIRVIAARLEDLGLIARRLNGRALARKMTTAEVEDFVASFEAHYAADHLRLRKIMEYGESVRCRVQCLREYFGEPEGARCGECDSCHDQ